MAPCKSPVRVAEPAQMAPIEPAQAPSITGDAPAPIEAANAGRCPSRDVLERIGDTWTVLVVLNLMTGPCRFNALRRQIGSVSQRMLTVTLRALERDGMVSRTVFATTPPQVQYALTPLGQSLAQVLESLNGWAHAHSGEVADARRRFDAAMD